VASPPSRRHWAFLLGFRERQRIATMSSSSIELSSAPFKLQTSLCCHLSTNDLHELVWRVAQILPVPQPVLMIRPNFHHAQSEEPTRDGCPPLPQNARIRREKSEPPQDEKSCAKSMQR